MGDVKRILSTDLSVLGKKVGNKKEKFSQAFGEWFLKAGKKRVLTHNDCAEFLSKLLDKDITFTDLRSYICQARFYLEANYKSSIWNVRGEGWRVATEEEKAIFLIRTARGAISRAQRTVNLYNITDEKHIEMAVTKVFGKASNAQARIAEYQGKFNMLFNKKHRVGLLDAATK